MAEERSDVEEQLGDVPGTLETRTDDESTERIKRDIEQTRGEMGETIDEIQERLTFANLSDQVEQAAQEKDRKKVEELLQKIIELEKQLGPEYLALVDALFNNNNMDLNSDDFEEIVSTFDRFDESCRH